MKRIYLTYINNMEFESVPKEITRQAFKDLTLNLNLKKENMGSFMGLEYHFYLKENNINPYCVEILYSDNVKKEKIAKFYSDNKHIINYALMIIKKENSLTICDSYEKEKNIVLQLVPLIDEYVVFKNNKFVTYSNKNELPNQLNVSQKSIYINGCFISDITKEKTICGYKIKHPTFITSDFICELLNIKEIISSEVIINKLISKLSLDYGGTKEIEKMLFGLSKKEFHKTISSTLKELYYASSKYSLMFKHCLFNYYCSTPYALEVDYFGRRIYHKDTPTKFAALIPSYHVYEANGIEFIYPEIPIVDLDKEQIKAGDTIEVAIMDQYINLFDKLKQNPIFDDVRCYVDLCKVEKTIINTDISKEELTKLIIDSSMSKKEQEEYGNDLDAIKFEIMLRHIPTGGYESGFKNKGVSHLAFVKLYTASRVLDAYYTLSEKSKSRLSKSSIEKVDKIIEVVKKYNANWIKALEESLKYEYDFVLTADETSLKEIDEVEAQMKKETEEVFKIKAFIKANFPNHNANWDFERIPSWYDEKTFSKEKIKSVYEINNDSKIIQFYEHEELCLMMPSYNECKLEIRDHGFIYICDCAAKYDGYYLRWIEPKKEEEQKHV